MKFEQSGLEGNLISLEPISHEHVDGITEAGRELETWRWMTFCLDNSIAVSRFIDHVTGLAENGKGFVFAIRCKSTGQIIGSSGYWHVDFKCKKTDIGGSWIASAFRGTGANTEAKFLLLRIAFEKWGFKRVSFSIDTRNTRSLSAIEKIGAVKEGVLRSDLVLHDGANRDSAIYSVLKDEWPYVKSRLEGVLSMKPQYA